MLIDVETGREIKRMPFAQDLARMKKRLEVDEFDAIIRHINILIEEAGGEVATAGWLPGSDWSDTPFELIYTKAAHRNHSAAAKLLGLAVWYTIKERPDRGGSGRYEIDGRDIGSRTYFRLNQ